MRPGRALNALVANRVLGWAPYTEQRGEYTHWCWFRADAPMLIIADRKPRMNVDPESYDPHKHVEDGLPDFSGKLTEAWKVVEAMRDSTEGDETMWTFIDCGKFGWRAVIEHNLTENDAPARLASVVAKTLPLAICHAALMAVGAEVPA